MKVGYYLAATGELVGDISLAQSCRVWWNSLGHPSPSRYDGAHACVRGPKGEERIELRLIARDLFREAKDGGSVYARFDWEWPQPG